MADKILLKEEHYPLPHQDKLKFKLSADTTQTAHGATALPLLIQDEGRGAPSSISTHPQNSSFAVYAGPNCFPDSRINSLFAKINMSLTKHCWNTDKIEELRVMVIPIFISFLENLTAKDEITGNEVEDVLELQHETTDRQTYPLYNGTKLSGDTLALGADVPGLTTNTNIEGVTFSIDQLFDALQYYSNKGKVRHSIGKIMYPIVRRRKSVSMRLAIRMKSKVKRMNEYTACIILIKVPNMTHPLQIGEDADSSTTDKHLLISYTDRYNEYNTGFDSDKM